MYKVQALKSNRVVYYSLFYDTCTLYNVYYSVVAARKQKKIAKVNTLLEFVKIQNSDIQKNFAQLLSVYISQRLDAVCGLLKATKRLTIKLQIE